MGTNPLLSTSKMRAAPVELFSTSILGNHKIRSRHERYVSVLTIKKVPYVYHDLASDEEAKSRWRRKAKDPQIPGLLVHNEWRGTFEEFEEAIEFGELDLFLNIDHERAQREAEQGVAPVIAEPTEVAKPSSEVSASAAPALPRLEERKPSKHVVNVPKPLAQPRAPSNTGMGPVLPTAAPRTVKRESADADALLRSLGLSDVSLSQQELDDILEAGSSGPKDKPSTSNGGQSKLGLGSAGTASKQPVQRTYIPSAEAGVKPLRLAKMGTQRSGSDAPAPDARYNSSIMSSRALAAEAQASTSSRAFSASRLRDAVSQGDDLKEAMSSTRAISNTDSAEQIVGREDLDTLMASLGLSDVKMTDEEAEAFLFQGTIPEGMASGGSKLGRAGSKSDIARKETAARDLAQKAKEKGYGTPNSPTRRSSKSSSSSSRSSSRSLSQTAAEIQKSIEQSAAPAAEETAAVTSADPVIPSEVGDQTTLIHDDEAPKKVEEASETARGSVDEVEQTPKAKLEPLPEGSGDTVMKKDGIAAESAPEASDSAEATREETSEPSTDAKAKEDTDDVKGSAAAAQETLTEGMVDAAREDVSRGAKGSGEDEADKADVTERDKQTTEPLTEDTKPPLDKEVAAEAKEVVDEPYKVTILSDTRTINKAADSPPSLDEPISLKTETKKAEPSANRTSSETASPQKSALHSPSSMSARRDSAKRPPDLRFDSSEGMHPSTNDLPSVSDAPKSAPVAQSHGSVSSPTQIDSGAKQASAPHTPASVTRSKSSRTPSTSPTSSRRRAIDVQRPITHSPSLSTSPSMMLSSPSHRQGSFSLTSPTIQTSSSMQRSSSQASHSSSNEAKSPSSRSGRKFFGLGRRRSTKGKKGSQRNSMAADEGSDEDISTTFPDMPESRSSPHLETSTGPASPKATDRSQKTLSMILREADEALGGEDDDGESPHERSSSSDDGMDSFHLELDDEGDIQARRS